MSHVFRIPRLAIAACLLAVLPIVAAAQPIATTHVEDFTTVQLADTLLTTADWNPAAGEIRLHDFSYDESTFVGGLGYARDVFVAGDWAFVASNDALYSVYIASPSSASATGSAPLGTQGRGVHVSGTYAYVADAQSGLTVVDISVPSVPTTVATADTPSEANAVWVEADLAYVADWSSGLQIFDVTSPTTPTLVGSVDTQTATDVVVAAGHAYVADGSSGLRIVDVSDPSSPTIAGSYDVGPSVGGIAISWPYAYLSGSNSLYVIDVSDSSAPALVGSSSISNANRVAIDGDRLFLTRGALGLQILDISDPTTPTFVADYDDSGTAAAGVMVSGEFVYIANGADPSALAVLQIGLVLDTPVPLSTYPLSQARDVTVQGNIAYLTDDADGLRIFDVTDPETPVLLSTFDTVDATSVDVSGNIACVADWMGGLQIVDVSDPMAPALLNQVATAFAAEALQIVDNLVYVVEQISGTLEVFDISNPAAAALVGSLAIGTGNARDIEVRGDYAYIAAYPQVLVIDVSDPTVPVHAATYAEDISRMDIDGDLLVGVTSAGTLTTMEVSGPALVSRGSLTVPGSWDVSVSGDYAFLSGPSLTVVDIRDRIQPTIVRSIDYGGSNSFAAIDVSGETAFVAQFGDGLTIFQVFQSEFDTGRNRGVSFPVDLGDETIVLARLTGTGTTGVDWELDADNDDAWEAAESGVWLPLAGPGSDLRWRSTHRFVASGVNPTITRLDIDWRFDMPVIASIDDVGNDQGRQVRLQWLRSGYDEPGSPKPIVEYAVFRRVDPNLVTSSHTTKAEPSPAAESALSQKLAGWDFVLAVPAYAEDQYSVVVPTLADSTVSEGQHYTDFFVRAATATPAVFWDAPVDSGYSVDNLDPSVPANFAIAFDTGSGNQLTWEPSPDEDFRQFRIYRDTDPEFTPSPATLVAATTANAWSDPDYDGAAVFYKLTAADFSGNESRAAEAETATSVEGDAIPQAPALQANTPNPFNPSTTIRYNLPAGGRPVRLTVYDAAGRLVRTLLNGPAPAGAGAVTWDGRNDGGQTVATGVYFYRMTTPRFTQTRKMMLLK